jgi:WD40 repeat protein
VEIRAIDAPSKTVAHITGEIYARPRFSPDDTKIAVATDSGPILLWDIPGRRELGWLRGHSLRVDGLAFSSHGDLLASASDDGSVRVWDLAERQALAVLRGAADSFWAVAFSPDGRRLASGTGDGRVALWDLTTQQPVATFRVYRSGIVGPLGFTLDGQTLIPLARPVPIGSPRRRIAGISVSRSCGMSWTRPRAVAFADTPQFFFETTAQNLGSRV